jgi:hypothetical protein
MDINRKTEILDALAAEHKEKLASANRLLENIRQHRDAVNRLLSEFGGYEPDFVYRFYHQSFKVFGAKPFIEQAKSLFEQLAPKSVSLNTWFCSIVDKAIAKEFDISKTNPNWIAETEPILEAFWHCKYFLEQMIIAADELERAPEVLPSGWAAVLYLYNLR